LPASLFWIRGKIDAYLLNVFGALSTLVVRTTHLPRKDEDDAFAKILAGKTAPANHPFAHLNKIAHYETTLIQSGRVFMQI